MSGKKSVDTDNSGKRSGVSVLCLNPNHPGTRTIASRTVPSPPSPLMSRWHKGHLLEGQEGQDECKHQ